MDKSYKYTCSSCGSSNIMWDAWAEWDEDKQEMVLNQSFDQTFCTDCDGECGYKRVEISNSVTEKSNN